MLVFTRSIMKSVSKWLGTGPSGETGPSASVKLITKWRVLASAMWRSESVSVFAVPMAWQTAVTRGAAGPINLATKNTARRMLPSTGPNGQHASIHAGHGKRRTVSPRVACRRSFAKRLKRSHVQQVSWQWFWPFPLSLTILVSKTWSAAFNGMFFHRSCIQVQPHKNVGVMDLNACKSACENDKKCVVIERHLNNTCILWYTKCTMRLLPDWTIYTFE